MNKCGAYMIAKSLYDQGWRSPLEVNVCVNLLSISEEESKWVIKQFEDIESMAKIMETRGEWWQNAKLAYIVFGRASESIDDALDAYAKLCDDDRRTVIDDALGVIKFDEMTGFVDEDGWLADLDESSDFGLAGFLFPGRPSKRAVKIVAAGMGESILRRALQQMESSLRSKSACQSFGSIAVMPDKYFVLGKAGTNDVSKAALKALTSIIRELDEESYRFKYRDDKDFAERCRWAKEGAYRAQRRLFDWLYTPCVGDCREDD